MPVNIDRHGMRDEAVTKNHAPRGNVRTYVPTDERTNICAADAARKVYDGRDAARAWADNSPFPEEAGIAGRRWKMYAPRLAHGPLLLAIAEAARESHHAAGALIEPYLRNRCARIAEELREAQKREERDDRPRHAGMRSMAAILGAAS